MIEVAAELRGWTVLRDVYKVAPDVRDTWVSAGKGVGWPSREGSEFLEAQLGTNRQSEIT